MMERLNTDVEVMKEHLEAKQSILRDVLEGVNKVDNKRNIIGQILHVNPLSSVQPSDIEATIKYCHGIDDSLFYYFKLKNLSSMKRSVYVSTIPSSTIRWITHDEREQTTRDIGPLSECSLLLSVPSYTFLSSSYRHLIIDYRSIESELLPDSRKPETITVELPSITTFYRIEDITRVDSDVCYRILHSLSIVWVDITIPLLSSSLFLSKYSQFVKSDFGSFQVLLGKGECKDIVLTSQPGRGSRLGRLKGRNHLVLSQFLSSLKNTFPSEF